MLGKLHESNKMLTLPTGINCQLCLLGKSWFIQFFHKDHARGLQKSIITLSIGGTKEGHRDEFW